MTISVAMINYNIGRYLRRAIESVLLQTRLPDELIIADDGSTDDSLEIIGEFAEKFSFIKLFRNPVNLGGCGEIEVVRFVTLLRIFSSI